MTGSSEAPARDAPARDAPARDAPARDAPAREAPPRTAAATFPAVELGVVVYAVAMAYLESAVVVYLQRALGIEVGSIFPLRDPGSLGGLGAIEVGREAATLVMLGAIGFLAGRSWLERLALTAVAFGVWDIAYYAWLWVFVGWPPSTATFDLLFLLPVPWVGPVWAPVTVSAALIGFGLAAARRLRAGRTIRVDRPAAAAAAIGGVVVIVSFTLDAGNVLSGGTPTSFAWPVFVAGMALAAWAALRALRGTGVPGSR